MDLPVAITPFTLALPWETNIGGTPVTEVTFDFELVNSRIYSNVGIGEYQNNGASASPAFSVGFALAVHEYSFSFDPGQFGVYLVQVVTEAVGRYFVQADVVASKPAGIPQTPTGVQWPLSDEVVAYIDGGGAEVPIPRGIYTAFRLFPSGEYATATEIISIFRGEVPLV